MKPNIHTAMLVLLLTCAAALVAADDTCTHPYYHFTPSTAKGTCYFTVEKKCSTSYANVKKTEWYTVPQIYTEFNVSTPSLQDSCLEDFMPKLLASSAQEEEIYFLWYPNTSYNHKAAYPFILYQEYWYQRLSVTFEKSFDDKTCLITSVDTTTAYVKTQTQPSNTKPSDVVSRANTDSIIAFIVSGCSVLLLLFLVVLLCRQKEKVVVFSEKGTTFMREM